MRSGSLGRPRQRLECLRRIAAARLDPARRFLLFNCVETYLQLDDRAAEQFAQLLAEAGNEEVENMAMTWADKVEEKGMQKGLEVGLQKGMEKGLPSGQGFMVGTQAVIGQDAHWRKH